MKLTINNKTIETQDYVDKWVNWALEETIATDEQVIKNVQWSYKQAGLKKPKVVIFRDYSDFVKYDWASVWDSMRASVRASVWDSMRASVGDSVSDSVRDSVSDSVSDSVWDSVSDSVMASVWDSVSDSVMASVRDSVRASVWDSVGAWYWSDDMSFADVFADCGVLSEEKKRQLQKYKEVLSTQRLAVYTKEVCYVLVAPKIIRNEAGQLHNDVGLAVDWSGTGLYYLDGVNLPKDLWEKIVNDAMTPNEVFAIENVEHRRIAYQYMDKKKMLELDDYKVLDEVKDDGYGNSMKVIEFSVEGFNEPFRYVNWLCPSTKREYFIETDKDDCWKAKQASFLVENISFDQEW